MYIYPIYHIIGAKAMLKFEGEDVGLPSIFELSRFILSIDR